MTAYQQHLLSHYSRLWDNIPAYKVWKKGPMKKLAPNFSILEFAPSSKRELWTYATSGLAQFCSSPIEIFIFSNSQDDSLIELLTAISYYHGSERCLNVGHTVNFGRPWQDASRCTFGLISLPYLDGPDLENMEEYGTKCYWLIPITKAELDFKKKFGLEKLEEVFDELGLDYANPMRPSLIK